MVPFAVLYGSLRVLSGFRVQSQGFRGSGVQGSRLPLKFGSRAPFGVL